MLKEDRRKARTPLETAGLHYELSNEFFRLVLDPEMVYSSGYFATGNETLEEAQRAKIDLALQGVGLKPGHRLLDVGCGWGAAVLRARREYGAKAVGLTLTKNQYEYARQRAQGLDGVEFRLQAWEDYHEPCDRIISFGAFEHFGSHKYDAFFTRCRELMPPDGRLFLQSMTIGKPSNSLKLFRYAYFLLKEVYFGGELPTPEAVVKSSRENGFELLHMESIRLHYPRTLDAWISNLEKNKEAAIRATDEEGYERFMKYLKGAAEFYRTGETNAYHYLLQVI